jgi:hypothetical protein
VQRAVSALRLVMDAAELTDAEMDALVDLILPKFVARSGLDVVTFRALVRAMHRAEEERRATWRREPLSGLLGQAPVPRVEQRRLFRRRLQTDRVQ